MVSEGKSNARLYDPEYIGLVAKGFVPERHARGVFRGCTLEKHIFAAQYPVSPIQRLFGSFAVQTGPT